MPFGEAIFRTYKIGSYEGYATGTSNSEAKPSDLIAWTDGKALIATGSPFDPVTYNGVTYIIGQANNAYVFPGIGLGAIVARAERVTEGMLVAAGKAVARMVDVGKPGASLLPKIDDLLTVSAAVGVEVVKAAIAEGAAKVQVDNIEQAVQGAMWQPVYKKITGAKTFLR